MPPVNGPPCGETVTTKAADCPAVTVAEPGEAPTAKFVTVIWRSEGSENARPLLLAATLRWLVPNGHSSVAPGEEPQPPVQLIFVSAHRFGSEKPTSVAVRLPPAGVFPLTVMLECPLKTV